MKEELLFGAAYYAEYMPYERIDRDMEMMKQAGMNVLRIAESTWSTLEPHDNVFDFSFLIRCLRPQSEKTFPSLWERLLMLFLPGW